MRRNPELKLWFDENYLKQTLVLQKDILNEAKQYVKTGGRLYYMTCSLLNDENYNQVRKFLSSTQGQFDLIEKDAILPEINGHDGFFYTIMEKIK